MTMPRSLPAVLLRLTRGALALAGAAALGGCVFGGPGAYGPRVGGRPLRNEVVRVLDVEEPSPAFFRERARLEVLGPELDAVLMTLVEDGSVDDNVRANALVLLADRRAPGAVTALRRALASSGSDGIRAAAARGLQRFVPDSVQARTALRAAAGDPSALVRLTVLQRMDVEDAPVVRDLLRVEENAQVRTIARQVLSLLEGRGAPLARDGRGDSRTTGPEDAPQIVFHPTWTDSLAGVEAGALWVELPGAGTLVPLGQAVEVVNGVVPAFFDPTRSVVVYEAEREIRIRDLRSGATVTLGGGVAPRVVPFTEWFVFVREVPEGRRPGPGDAVVIDYEVLRATFAGGSPDVIGRVRATVRPEVRRAASPVRWMVVGESRDGLVLRAPGLTPFILPGGPLQLPPPPPPPTEQ